MEQTILFSHITFTSTTAITITLITGISISLKHVMPRAKMKTMSVLTAWQYFIITCYTMWLMYKDTDHYHVERFLTFQH